MLLLVVLSNLVPLAALVGGDEGQVRWWGVGLPMAGFTAASAAGFAAWALVGAWRAMARELREPCRHWAWPAFAAFTALWWAGLAPATGPRPPLASSLSVAGFILAIATYVGAVLDPLTPVGLARFTQAWSAPAQAWRPRVPGWSIDAVLAVTCGALAFAVADRIGPPAGMRAWLAALSGLLAAPVALMALRDAAIVSCFALWPGSTRPVAVAAFYIALADILVPAVLASMGQPLLARVVCPLWGFAAQPLACTAAMAVHAVVAIVVLGMRIRGMARQPA
jgi:hypothetical protein